MNTTVTLSLSQDVYERVQEAAAQENRTMEEVLSEDIAGIYSVFPKDPRREQMDIEVAAYERQHTQLVDLYLGRYIAMKQGVVLEDDVDLESLVKRVRVSYPNEVILFRKVRSVASHEVVIRSPRLLKDKE